MVILLTNDDGVHADGLQALRAQMEKMPGIEVFVVAPDKERSASGHGITIHQPLRVEEVSIDGSRARIWAVSGTPADCTKIGIRALLPGPPSLVISGINRGPNLGTDVFYSGTVAAALEAAVLGVPAIAMSLNGYENLDYSYASRVAACLAGIILKRGMTPNSLLNVNIPALEPEHIAGMEVTRLGVRRYNDEFERKVDAKGDVYYWLAGGVMDVENAEGTDVGAIQQNKVSITPIHLDLTAHWAMDEICAWEIDLPDRDGGGPV
ncbi:MAG: 5'/3'-nucleotidase SurE [Firmicutes bacterium]|nr:5'/3'-nucleotidase SurE [Bacillota bacterium]